MVFRILVFSSFYLVVTAGVLLYIWFFSSNTLFQADVTKMTSSLDSVKNSYTMFPIVRGLHLINTTPCNFFVKKSPTMPPVEQWCMVKSPVPIMHLIQISDSHVHCFSSWYLTTYLQPHCTCFPCWNLFFHAYICVSRKCFV